MDPLHPIDRIRARAVGELSPEDRLELESELAADPELARLAEAYDDVHRVTEAALAAEGGEPRSRAGLEDLERWLDGDGRAAPARAAQPRRTRRAAAAAVLLVALGGLTWLGLRARAGPSEVVLRAIPEAAPAAQAEASFGPVAERLVDYVPVSSEGIAWIDDIEAGRALAQATGRPMLLWGIHPTCPICAKMRETTLEDAEVQEAVQAWVPMQLDVMVTERYADLDPFDKGFPIFELLGADFEELDTFFNYRDAEEFSQRLAAGLERHTGPPALSWERAAELAGAWLEAREAERERRFGDSLTTYLALYDNGQGTSITDAAARGIARIAHAAWSALEEARREPLPEATLARAAREFAGTRYAPEFEALAAAARRSGELPELRWER